MYNNNNCNQNNRIKVLNSVKPYSSTVNPALSYLYNPGKEPLRFVTIGQLLEETVKKFGDNLAIISRHQNVRLTYRQVLDEADNLAAGLKTIGLEKGDILAVWAPNQIEWYITNMACARAGLILATINPAFQPVEMEYCLNKVGAKAVVCGDKFKTQDYYKHLLAIAPELEKCEPGKLKSSKVPNLKSVIVISEDIKPGAYIYKDILEIANKNYIREIKENQHLIKTNDPCNIQFTSGTTGKSKAACASHFNYVNNGYFVGKRNELGQKHHTICVQVPFFHAYGTVVTIMAALNFGSTLVLPDYGYNPDKILDAIRDEKCTTIHGTPTMYLDLIQKQEQRQEDISPEIAINGAGDSTKNIPEEIIRVLRAKKIKHLYGLTESTAIVFHSLEDDDLDKIITTVGYLGEHMEVKLIDSNNRIVPFGVPGELCIRSYSNILGYWDDEEKTKELIGPDGWLKTGDQFVLTKNGYGKIVGRLKDMIIRGGENIFPKEIENFLISHPSIFEIQVIGIPHARLGEEVCACIRLKPDSNLTQKELTEFCKGKIAHFKIPSKLMIVDDFPKTTSGKIQKFKLQEMVKENKCI